MAPEQTGNERQEPEQYSGKGGKIYRPRAQPVASEERPYATLWGPHPAAKTTDHLSGSALTPPAACDLKYLIPQRQGSNPLRPLPAHPLPS